MTKPDWKHELRDVLKEALFLLTCNGGDSWTIVITDERMKELEKMGLWNMESAGWND